MRVCGAWGTGDKAGTRRGQDGGKGKNLLHSEKSFTYSCFPRVVRLVCCPLPGLQSWPACLLDGGRCTLLEMGAGRGSPWRQRPGRFAPPDGVAWAVPGVGCMRPIEASAGRSRGKQFLKSQELQAPCLWITFTADLHKKTANKRPAANPHGCYVFPKMCKSYPHCTVDTTGVMLIIVR